MIPTTIPQSRRKQKNASAASGPPGQTLPKHTSGFAEKAWFAAIAQRIRPMNAKRPESANMMRTMSFMGARLISSLICQKMLPRAPRSPKTPGIHTTVSTITVRSTIQENENVVTSTDANSRGRVPLRCLTSRGNGIASTVVTACIGFLIARKTEDDTLKARKSQMCICVSNDVLNVLRAFAMYGSSSDHRERREKKGEKRNKDCVCVCVYGWIAPTKKNIHIYVVGRRMLHSAKQGSHGECVCVCFVAFFLNCFSYRGDEYNACHYDIKHTSRPMESHLVKPTPTP